jgi:hypothetical protein
MKKMIVPMLVILAAALMVSCQAGQKYHKTDLPDPAAYDSNFSDLDKNGNGAVNWAEFKRHFPEASPDVFFALDGNGDAAVDAEEWARFREAHGM